MAFQVFDQMLYMRAIQLVNLSVYISKKKKKQGTPKKGSRLVASHGEEELDDHISITEVRNFEELLNDFLPSLDLVSKFLSLVRYPTTLKDTIATMLPVVIHSQGSASKKALAVVEQFCDPKHGEALKTVECIFIYLLPLLALSPAEKDLSNRDIIAMKDMSFNLVVTFADKFADSIYPLLKGLIQHLCEDVVDKVDQRQRTAQTAFDLMNLVSAGSQKGIFQIQHKQTHVSYVIL